MPNIEGKMDDRLLAIFTSVAQARDFIRKLKESGIEAKMRTV